MLWENVIINLINVIIAIIIKYVHLIQNNNIYKLQAASYMADNMRGYLTPDLNIFTIDSLVTIMKICMKLYSWLTICMVNWRRESRMNACNVILF